MKVKAVKAVPTDVNSSLLFITHQWYVTLGNHVFRPSPPCHFANRILFLAGFKYGLNAHKQIVIAHERLAAGEQSAFATSASKEL